MYLNRHIQPHVLNLALNITGLTHDDLCYYRNKLGIDEIAVRFQTRARELVAAPNLWFPLMGWLSGMGLPIHQLQYRESATFF